MLRSIAYIGFGVAKIGEGELNTQTGTEDERRKEAERLPKQALSADEIKRFRVTAKPQVLGILHDIAMKKTLMRAFFAEDNKESFITDLVGTNDEKMLMFISLPCSDSISRKLYQNLKLILSTKIDRVQIQFETNLLRKSKVGGNEVLVCPIPDWIGRFQRREFFRAEMSAWNPIMCEVTYENADGDMVTQAYPIYDLSLGGLSLLKFPVNEPGTEIKGAHFFLPDVGPIKTDMVVRNIISTSKPDNTVLRRVGCQFENLSPQMETMLQRYLFRLEQDNK